MGTWMPTTTRATRDPSAVTGPDATIGASSGSLVTLVGKTGRLLAHDQTAASVAERQTSKKGTNFQRDKRTPVQAKPPACACGNHTT